jgi:hypothetical protein
MFSPPALTTKYQALSRRVALLSSQLDTWIARAATGDTLEKNFSQIRALDYFMRTLCRLNEESCNTLNPAGDVDTFLSGALDLTERTIKTHTIWDFFRDRLELRFVPQFQQPLLMADLVCHDCYSLVMDRAESLQIVPKHGFREYPLIGLVSQFSAATWRRGGRPPALENQNLPLPVVDMPWDCLVNPWELLVIAHEVGHDVDEDLGRLSMELQPIVSRELDQLQTPMDRILQWQRWTSEILADLVGILLMGPVYARTLTGLLMLPRHLVRRIGSATRHPPHYLRTFVNTALIHRLGFSRLGKELEAGWQALYGKPNDEFSPYFPDIEPVISAILDTPLMILQSPDSQLHSLSELISFTPDDQAAIQEAVTKLITGIPIGRLQTRHVVSASQLAFEQMTEAGNATQIEELAQHTCQTIIDTARPGQLRAGLAHRAQKHLDRLARAALERPLDDFGSHWPT